MAENRIIEYCMLNVAANPHPSGVYVELLQRAAFQPVNFWGELIATVSRPERVGDGFYRGRLVIWTEIDKTEPAILTDQLTEVDFDDLKINIPENVGFNGRVFLYILRESDHTLFVETRNDLDKRLSPSRAEKIFSMLFSEQVQGVDAPLVEVTAIPEDDALSRILALPRLKRLKIHIVRPNADDIDADDILAEMEEQGARSQDILLVASPQSNGIKPNERTQKQAEVAEYNGFVDGTGIEEDGESVSLSTKQYPRIIRRIFGEFGSAFDEALRIAKETIARRPSA